MRSYIIYLTGKYHFINKLINSALKFRNNLIPLKFRLKQRFKRLLGYDLNLKNPKTFNEKIQWLKLYDRTPWHTICADKYEVRNFISEKIGTKYLVPLVLHTTNPDDINPLNLPEYPIIIKTNHDSSGGVFVRDKNVIDWKATRKQLKERLSVNYDNGKGEWQYRDIPPKIIVEKLLTDEDGNIPVDYKMHYFNGKLAFTQVDMDRETDHKRNLYDPEWNFIPCTWAYKNGHSISKPKVYAEMKHIAQILAKDFLYVRVDLYVVSDLIYFGELTFHSDSGNGKFTPQKWDEKIGQLLQLPI